MSNYSRIKSCALGGIILVLVFIMSCSIEEWEGTLVSQTIIISSKINGKEYNFDITKEILKDSSDWVVDKRIPFTAIDAVKIAELEIANYSKEKDLWHLKSIELKKFGLTDKWFYVIEFNKITSHDSEMVTNDYLRIPVLLSGKAVKGKMKKNS